LAYIEMHLDALPGWGVRRGHGVAHRVDTSLTFPFEFVPRLPTSAPSAPRSLDSVIDRNAAGAHCQTITVLIERLAPTKPPC